MYTINVIDGNNGKTVRKTDVEHNDRNIQRMAVSFIEQYGAIIEKNEDSDCITIVTYERGCLGFSI